MNKFLLSCFLFFAVGLSQLVQGQDNTPPSCVVTAPHNNAYFQAGKAMTIRVYAADIGGSFANGTVSKVEFFNGGIKLGESTSGTDHSFTFVWRNLVAGTYTLTAKATDNLNLVSTSAGVMVTVGTSAAPTVGLSAGKGKYLANIVAGSMPANFNTLWNGVTSENNTKWGVVESTRDVMNWNGANVAYNHAKNNYLPFRYHVIAWGSQYPGWAINSSHNLLLSPADFKEEVEEYMAAIAAQFPNSIDQFDVLNENLRTHAAATPAFREGLGGNGTTGHDWIIWLFTKARQYFPNSKLILNDYGLENDLSAINEQLLVIKLLRDRNLIDGFGTQSHQFNINTLSAVQVKNALDLMDNSGVPIYVTELDISGDDNTQSNRYQTVFPAFWEHPAVAGITLWGYEEGKTWIANTHLTTSLGSDRPAMTWLKSYMASRPNVGYPFSTQESTVSGVKPEIKTPGLVVYPNPSERDFTLKLPGAFSYELFTATGGKVAAGTGQNQTTLGQGLKKGIYLLKISQKEAIKVFKVVKN